MISRDIEPNLAKRLASGDVDPISLLQVIDTNPEYCPRALKSVKLSEKGKGKARANPVAGQQGLFNFFSMSNPQSRLSRS
jgi:exonuclease-1